MSSFDLLHPAVQHHIVNSLGWRSLRPLQEDAIEPILAGAHAVLLAPTAGGKTEAAIFPVLSRMLAEDWRGLTVVYICPIKALLNNLEHRLRRYCELLGRSAGIWHGDVSASQRRRLLADPPDVLLTTPESLEVMLVSSRTDSAALFADLRCVIVDEIHAFAGDDRGWHLLSVLERVSRLSGRDLQRLGLSATVGNPERLLAWLAGSTSGSRRVLAPPGEGGDRPEITVDFVGHLSNAAAVLSRLYRGEKRLVFVDSRARVEQLAAALHELDVETYVSHSSLSLDERRRAEAAFAEGGDCVIVATSTLELGIDVGDLDRIVQIDAPGTVASFLQRLGRSGRRPGTTRNCLFLATSEDELTQTLALLLLWSDGYVEPLQPPPLPYHVFAQQIMGLCLQEQRIGRNLWGEWIGRMPAFAEMPAEDLDRTLAHMLSEGILGEDEGMLQLGPKGEELYGRRHFLELMSVFTSPPLFRVRHGRTEIGLVHELSLQVPQDRRPVLSLAGRGWGVTFVDWSRGIVYVEPADETGRSRWLGEAQPLSFEMCQSIRRVLVGATPPVTLSRRAEEKVAEVRNEYRWVRSDATTLLRDEAGEQAWWTFAGLRANLALQGALGELAGDGAASNLSIPVAGHVTVHDVRDRLLSVGSGEDLAPEIDDQALEGVKFVDSLPRELAVRMLARRLADPEGVASCVAERTDASILTR